MERACPGYVEFVAALASDAEIAQDAPRVAKVRRAQAQVGKIGIAFSGGPNPVEIVDLIVLAESLGYDRIAEGHGGSLTLENRKDTRGCRARLTLPA